MPVLGYFVLLIWHKASELFTAFYCRDVAQLQSQLVEERLAKLEALDR